MHVCVCVCERERDGEREAEKEWALKMLFHKRLWPFLTRLIWCQPRGKSNSRPLLNHLPRPAREPSPSGLLAERLADPSRGRPLPSRSASLVSGGSEAPAGDESGDGMMVFGRPPSYLDVFAPGQTVCICVISWRVTASMMDEMPLLGLRRDDVVRWYQNLGYLHQENLAHHIWPLLHWSWCT